MTDLRMPALYLSHGAPPLLDDPLWSAQLAAWSADLPRPTAILIVSRALGVGPGDALRAAAGTPLVYDFGGFAQRYYEMTYPTPDAGDLARRVAAMMPDTEPVHQHRSRGLDHGAWVPLKVMYPAADIPVLQMSLPTHDPDRLLDARPPAAPAARRGRARHRLRLPHPRPAVPDGVPHRRGRPRLVDRLRRLGRRRPGPRRRRRARAYRATAPGMPYAHPTVEHYTPLFVTLGAATDPEAPGEQVIDGFWMGLSKRSLQVA